MGTATTFLSLALARLGHDVEILVGVNRLDALDPYWRALYARAGVQLREAPPIDERIEPWEFRHSHAIALGLQARPSDVVIAPDFGAAGLVALQLRETDVALADTLFVTFCHGPRRYVMDVNGVAGPNDLRNLLAVGVHEQACVELSDVIVSPSRYLLNWMRRAGWTLPERTFVIPYFTRSSATGEQPSRAGTSPGAALERLAFFGRVDERKGLLPFTAGLNRLDPLLLERVELEFVGRTSQTWTPERVEHLLTRETKDALRGVSFASTLDQPEALARLSRPGTVAVLPSLEENSPNAIYECLETGIPFLASNVGGVPELIHAEDRARTLFPPTADGVADALRRLLTDGTVPQPVRPAFAFETSSQAWDEVVRLHPTARPARDHVDTSSFVVVSDDAVDPDQATIEALARAQAATGADAITCGTRVGNAVHLFVGEPRGLGAVENGYGTLALVRSSLIRDASLQIPVWSLLARVAASGARIVSIPEPLAEQRTPPANVESDPDVALRAVQELERALPPPVRALARVSAGLAAHAGEQSAPAGRRRLWPLAVLMLTLAGATLRFATLGRQSYWYDELATVAVLRHSFGGMLHAVATREATPYLYYVLAWPWTRLFGLHETALRSLSALAGTLTIPATYAAGRAFVSRRAGVIAAALVAFNPFLVWYSQEARAYALLVLFAALSLVFLARRNLVWWATTAALAVATHYFAVFIVAAEAVVLLAHLRRRALLAVGAPVAVAIAEIPLLAKQHTNGGNLSDTSLVRRIAGTPKDLVVGYSFPAEAAGTAIAIVLVLVGVVLAARRGARVPLAIAIAALVVPIVVAVGGADYVVARNLIAVTIPAAIFLAAGYASRRIGFAAAAALCVLSLAIVVAVAADRLYGRTDWRGAAHALGRATAPRAIVTTPTIDGTLWRPYVAGLEQPQTLRVREIDVVGLATQGGFSAGAVKPPPAAARPSPPSFHLADTRSTPTYSLVRYVSPVTRPISAQDLARLALAASPAAVFYQDSRR